MSVWGYGLCLIVSLLPIFGDANEPTCFSRDGCPGGDVTAILQNALDNYTPYCICGYRYINNCAHFLSNALIKAGFSDIDGGTSTLDMRRRNGYIVCRSGRPIRAKELRRWFRTRFTYHTRPQVGFNLVYQENAWGQGHVMLRKYKSASVYGWVGTGDYPTWPIQEYYY